MKYGYVRVSSTTQNIARQVEEMKKFVLPDTDLPDITYNSPFLSSSIAKSNVLYPVDIDLVLSKLSITSLIPITDKLLII